MFILNPYTKTKLPLVLEIDTTKSGVTPSNGFQIPANAPSEIYSYKVDWGDGTKTNGHTGVASHTYAVGGIYQVKIYGEFPRMYFNNGGDRQKLLKVLDWGEINYSTDQAGAFYGCVNLDFIATDVLNAWYNNIVLGNNMFYNSSLTSLPDGMTLASLTDGTNMFRNNSITSLPSVMTLANLTNGGLMFYDNSITSLPSVMTLSNMTNGNSMFYNNSLTNVDNLTLSSCVNLTGFVRNNPNFNGQINVGTQVLTSITALGWNNKWSQDMSAWVFSPDCSFGGPAFNPALSNSIEFTNEHWGKLLIRVNALCGAGSGRTALKVLGVRNTVKYPASAATARQELIDDGWDIRDGGAE